MKFCVSNVLRFCFMGYLFCNLFFLSGCSILTFVGVTTVEIVALSTLGIYKGSEAVVTGTGNLLGIESSEQKKKSVHDAKYRKGVYIAYHKESIKNLYAAGHKALTEMEFQAVSGKVDQLSGRLEATTVDRKMILITISTAKKYKGKREFHIRIGSKGDEQISKMIYHKIVAHFDTEYRKEDNEDSGKTYYSNPDKKNQAK